MPRDLTQAEKDILKLAVRRSGWRYFEIAAGMKNPDGSTVSPSSITYWLGRGRVPSERVLELEALIKVPKEVIRPDLYLPAGAEPET